MEDKSIFIYLFMFFAFFSSLHGLFGKNLNKYLWYGSLLSSVLAGLIIGLMISFSTKGVLIGLVMAIPIIGINCMTRLARRRHER
jgi:hypothetical protein